MHLGKEQSIGTADDREDGLTARPAARDATPAVRAGDAARRAEATATAGAIAGPAQERAAARAAR